MRLETLRSQAMRHAQRSADAESKRVAYLAGVPPPPPPSMRNTEPPEGADEVEEDAAESAAEGAAALASGEFLLAADHFARAASSSTGWAAAGLQLRRARSLRRAGAEHLEDAERALRMTLGIFPNYADALLEKALTGLDSHIAHKAHDAIRSLERLNQVRPDTDGVGSWLQFAHAAHERLNREAKQGARQRSPRGEMRPPVVPPGCEVVDVGAHEEPEEIAATRRQRHHAAAAARAAAAAAAAESPPPASDVLQAAAQAALAQAGRLLGVATEATEATKATEATEAGDAATAQAAVAADGGKVVCCLKQAESQCPGVVDRSNWYGDGQLQHYGDRFRVEVHGTSLMVRRIDVDADAAGGGWGLSLRVLCCSPPGSEGAKVLAATQEEQERLAAAEAAAAEAAALNEARGHYWVLGIPCDFSASELKRAYRQLSLRLHPDRQGGDTAKMARVAAAYECLQDAECKRSFDIGMGIDGFHHEQVEKHYFPERYPFEPFGDPFEHDRDPARRQRSQERRKERMWTPPTAGPSLTGEGVGSSADEDPPRDCDQESSQRVEEEDEHKDEL